MIKTSYSLFKAGKLVGYLVGSFHCNFSPIDFQETKDILAPIIPQCEQVCLEAQMPHHSQMALGTEKAVLEIVEKNNMNEKLSYFESTWFQHAMLQCSLWFGTTIRTMPWLRFNLLTSSPIPFYSLSRSVSIVFQIYNMIYNLFSGMAHTQAVRDYAAFGQEEVLRLYTTYKKGLAPEVNNDDKKRYLMIERDTAMVEQIIAQGDNVSLNVVGASHLVNMIPMLEAAGYECKEWNL